MNISIDGNLRMVLSDSNIFEQSAPMYVWQGTVQNNHHENIKMCLVKCLPTD